MSAKARELKKLRAELGITQASLAEALNVTQAFISSLEQEKRENDEFVSKAILYLQNTVGPGRGNFTPLKRRAQKYSSRSTVQSEKSGLLNWAWSSFSKQRDTSDIFDYAPVGSKAVSLLVADIVGSGIRGSWEAAQIRFGFHAIASTLNKYNNHPSAFLGPIGYALQKSKTRRRAPPSIAIAALDGSVGGVNLSSLGLPSPSFYKKKVDLLSRQPSQAADLLNSGTNLVSFITLPLDEGDSIIICTDGFYDWLKQSKGLSTQAIQGLFAEACKYFSGNANGIVNSIISAKSNAIDSNLTDDATIVVIGREKS